MTPSVSAGNTPSHDESVDLEVAPAVEEVEYGTVDELTPPRTPSESAALPTGQVRYYSKAVPFPSLYANYD